VFGKIYEKEFQHFKKINYPTIDLYSLDNEIAQKYYERSEDPDTDDED